MAKTKDYLDYLNSEVGIAPVSSQEELDCAQSLAEVFTSHGLETQVEEFSVPALGQLGYGAVMVLLFLGVLIAGFGGVATFVGIVLALLAAALLLMARSGKDFIAGFGPRAQSQNVVALHEAEGEDTAHNRPIVIVAHYDTKRLDLLAKPGISVVQKYLACAMPYVVCAAGLCVIIQLLVFLPEGARRTFWVLGVIASLPMLAWGVCTIASKFLPYAQGAVDNKSSVAAMLGVLEDVAPLGEATHEAEPVAVSEDAPVVHDSVVQPAVAPAEPEMRRVVEEVMGARHGERVLRDLGILPAACEITYIEPEVRMVPVAPVAAPAAPAASVDAEFDSQATQAMPALTEDAIDTEGAVAEAVAPAEAAADPDATRAFTPLEQAGAEAVDAPVEAEPAAADPDATNPLNMLKRVRIDTGSAAEMFSKVKSQAASKLESVASRLRHLEDGQRTDEGPVIETEQEGLSTMVAEDATEAAETPREQREEPAAIEDPNWGKSSFAPGNVPAAPVPAPAAGDETQPMPAVEAEASEVAVDAPAAEPEPEAASSDAEATAPLAPQAPATPSVPVKRIDTTSVARRAALFDLPNPESETPDALAPVQPLAAQGPAPVRIEAAPAPSPRQSSQPAALASDIQVLTAGSSREYSNKRPAGLFGKKAAKQDDSMSSWLGVEEDFDAKSSGEKIGSWDNFGEGEARGSHWKGGAARSAETRGDEAADDAELRDAVLAMDEDALRAHDIWFVATGGSACGHAGIKHFIDLHKKSLRGAFVINLENVGAGELVALTREGAGNARRADRRLLRSLSSIARDLHIGLGQMDRAWADTEATPVMRKSMRVVTLMGMGAGELPAYSQTEFDVPENVDAAQVADVNALVSEFIRRS